MYNTMEMHPINRNKINIQKCKKKLWQSTRWEESFDMAGLIVLMPIWFEKLNFWRLAEANYLLVLYSAKLI